MKNDMVVYQEKLKENIKQLVNQNRLNEAKELLNQYEDIIKDDVDIYSIRGVIAMMEGDMDGALKSIKKGLELAPQNLDLLYNKAYIMELMDEYKKSYKIYKKILDNINDNENFKDEIKNKLSKIKKENRHVNLSGKLALLLIDQKTDTKTYNYIINWFHEFGFTILNAMTINNLKLEMYNINKCVILYDLNPVDLNDNEKERYPNVDNKRYFLINSLQKQLNLNFGINNINKYLYLTKHEKEAESLVRDLLLGDFKKLCETIEEMEKKYETQYPVIKLFDGFRHRAKTELIRYRDGLAVKKTWKPGNERFFEREKFACGKLSKQISYIPPLLESGENYIIIPYYENMINEDDIIKKRILTTHIVDIACFLKQLYEHGYFNPDIHPGQFIFSEPEGLKAIDHEYLQAYDNKPSSFAKSYDIQGYPSSFRGDKPNYIGRNLHSWYDELWIKYTGYNLEQIADLVGNGKYDNNDQNINKVMGLLNYSKTSGKSYDGFLYENAYHSLRLKGYYFRGQRECDLRLQKVPYDFSGKVVVDIGCNAGGMLHSISDKIKLGVGIDYDHRLINAANAIKAINNSNNLSFYRFDLENEELNLINNYVLSDNGKIDICFLLSICMWIKNWREVIQFVSRNSKNLLFETNGTQEQQIEQIGELKKNYKSVKIIEEESNDDPGQPNRKLIFCKGESSHEIIIDNNITNYDTILNKIIKPEYEIFYKSSSMTDKICRVYINSGDTKDVDFKQYMEEYFDFEFYRSYFNLVKNIRNIKGIVTGLSYFEVGIDAGLLKVPFSNLAISSQDLFYDFSMLKYVIEELDIGKNINKVIIGLSNYSFRYDLSLTQNPLTKERPKIYYPILKKLHNYPGEREVIAEYQDFNQEFSKVFKEDYMCTIYEMIRESFDNMWDNMMRKSFDIKRLSIEQRNREIYLAERWNKGYPTTKKENIDIFYEMIKFLKNKNIEPIIVTNPATDFYKKYFPKDCRGEFLNIINDFKKEFEFTLIDGYGMDCFEDNDFYDASHLNKKGAKKFTEIINTFL